MTGLSWQTLVPFGHPKFNVKGTELSKALLPKCKSRFCIYEVRSLDENGEPDLRYRIRDAETVSDQEIKEGGHPKVVIDAPTFETAMSRLCAKVVKEGYV